MTGRELIIYILSNGLEDEQVYENGRLLGFMTPSEAAVKFEVGLATILAWAKLGMLTSIEIGGEIYIPANAQVEGVLDVQKSSKVVDCVFVSGADDDSVR